MSDFGDFKNQIADWANRQDWTDVLVTSFVRMAEQKLNAELRVDRMIVNFQGLVASRCAPLPGDWLEFVSGAGIMVADDNPPSGWLPLRYKARDEFFATPDKWAQGFYTIQDREIYLGGWPDLYNGKAYKIRYYAEVPAFSDTTNSWVYAKYPNLYLFCALMHADLRAVGEEQTAATLKNMAEDTIMKLNADHLRAMASGSRITRTRIRSFG